MSEAVKASLDVDPPTAEHRMSRGVLLSLARRLAYEDRRMLEIRLGFERSGGLASAEQVVELVRKHSDQPISRLARWIVSRQVLCLEWRSQTLLPMFQFDVLSMEPWPGVSQALAELPAAYDDWDLMIWFSQPSPWLDARTPADLIVADLPAVLQAARADRFVEKG